MTAHPTPGTCATEGAAIAPRRLAILLRRAWYGLNQGFRDRIDRVGITPHQFSILRWLSESPPEGVSQRALADLLATDPNTVSSTLARMETSGLILRVPHESDRRASRVRLRPAGRAAYEKGRPLALAHQERILNALPPERRDDFLRALEIVADACTASEEKPS